MSDVKYHWPDKYDCGVQYASAKSDAVDMAALAGNPQAYTAWHELYHVQYAPVPADIAS